MSYDVAIIGLGAMGSAAAFHLAERGMRVLGLDRFQPPHEFGSSHGQTRIIREAYFEDPRYVPLLQRAYELWAALPAATDAPLLQITGGLMLGPPGRELFEGAKASAQLHRLPHRVLIAEEVRAEFPALCPTDNQAAVWEPRAGILFPERCITTHLSLAAQRGATLRYHEPLLRWLPDGDGFRLETDHGAYHADQILITAGAWVSSLLRGIQLPFTIERQVLFWFEAASAGEEFLPHRCPVHLWETAAGEFFYGFPDLGNGIKLARHHGGTQTSAAQVDRTVSEGDLAAMRELLASHIPKSNGPMKQAAVCVYTNTPDSHFWLDRHPEHSKVLIASPCSGHGFKFASVMGEVLANELCGGEDQFDLSLFRSRFES